MSTATLLPPPSIPRSPAASSVGSPRRRPRGAGAWRSSHAVHERELPARRDAERRPRVVTGEQQRAGAGEAEPRSEDGLRRAGVGVDRAEAEREDAGWVEE
jgi:hypothetical protein